ncbi:MAG: hypothetical protein EBT98_12695 [Opitutaceae bacterium]|nr:hypothetical protein [Opitutaceae bacterium]
MYLRTSQALQWPVVLLGDFSPNRPGAVIRDLQFEAGGRGVEVDGALAEGLANGLHDGAAGALQRNPVGVDRAVAGPQVGQ